MGKCWIKTLKQVQQASVNIIMVPSYFWPENVVLLNCPKSCCSYKECWKQWALNTGSTEKVLRRSLENKQTKTLILLGKSEPSKVVRIITRHLPLRSHFQKLGKVESGEWKANWEKEHDETQRKCSSFSRFRRNIFHGNWGDRVEKIGNFIKSTELLSGA